MDVFRYTEHANATRKELVPNENSLLEAPQTDSKERRKQKKKYFDDNRSNLSKSITETTFIFRKRVVCKILPTL